MVESDLPLVLCGPLLRRTDRYSCSVWIALKMRCVPRLSIFNEATGHKLAESDDEFAGVQLGRNLWVYLVTANGEFPRDTFLEYDVTIEGRSLEDLGLNDLALPGFRRPSFLVPSETRRMLVGSCRKPHGRQKSRNGVPPDNLTSGLRIVEQNSRNLSDRPSTLLLLGDQIYADDVAGPLLESLRRCALLLMGLGEDIPGIGPVDELRYGGRWEATSRIGFTSGHADHHLLSLGEFCAMYIAILGGFSLPLPDWEHIEQRRRPIDPEDRNAFMRERALVEEFLKSASDLRRLFANVASYGIFDDHEVTDDWNLDRSAHQNILESAGARRVAANALCAYWAFQGWGNAPEEFNATFLDTVGRGFHENGNCRQLGTALENQLLGFANWQFHTPTSPSVVFLDTRTQRRYVGSLGLGQLAGPYELQRLRASIRKTHATFGATDSAYIVTTTPVLGFMPIEWLQGLGRRIFKPILDATDWDFESWIAQRDGYFELMRSVLDTGVRKCVFLSGDVHYGFVKSGRFEHRGESCAVVQLVSSALNNESAGSFMLRYLEFFGKRTERRFGFLGTSIKSKILRWLRPLVSVLALFRLYRLHTQDGHAWIDHSKLRHANRKHIIQEGHILEVRISGGSPTRAVFHCASGVHEFDATFRNDNANLD